MPRSHNHLWREVFWCATERVWLLTILLHDFGQSKVSEHDVAVVIQQNIFWLQVTVDDVAFM